MEVLSFSICVSLCSASVTYCTMALPGFSVSMLPLLAVAFLMALPRSVSNKKKKSLRIIAAIVPAILLLAGALYCAGPFLSLIRDGCANGFSKELVAEHSADAQPLSIALCLLLSLLISALLRGEYGTLLVFLLDVVTEFLAFSLSNELSLISALPGLCGGVQILSTHAAMRGKRWRPAVLPCVAAVMFIAFFLTPAEDTVLPEAQQFARRLRNIAEDYIHFTESRIAFSISDMGYDHGGQLGNDVVSMLGGVANPSEKKVMQVRTDRDLLLRGTIKTSYTGYSWTDESVKNRYLWYDLLHRDNRSKVFDMGGYNSDEYFDTVEAEIRFLTDGTSTLFVPTRLRSVEMSLEEALYYNTAGEMFLSHNVTSDVNYRLTALVPKNDDALMQAAELASPFSEAYSEEIAQTYTVLPSGIDQALYELSFSLTQNEASTVGKVIALREWLATHCAYTLEGSYPEFGRDFVSWFVLEEQKGYCSYFASALTVMCRIVGIPARYVEGYYVQANASGESIVSGRNAHAWTEVYLDGLGWIAFDATARAYAQQNGIDEDDRSVLSGQPELSLEDDSKTMEFLPEDGNTPQTGAMDDGEDPQTQDETDEPQDGDDELQDNGADEGQDDADEPQSDAADQGEKGSLDYIPILFVVLLLAALVLTVWRWLNTDPLRRIRKANSEEAAEILYRANLLLLEAKGLVRQCGETAKAYAERTGQQLYMDFAYAYCESRYAQKAITKQTVTKGTMAYCRLYRTLSLREKLHYILLRLRRGIDPGKELL